MKIRPAPSPRRFTQPTHVTIMRVSRFVVRGAGAAAIAALLASCGGSDASTTGPGQSPSTSTSIDVGDNFFSPRATTVPVGSTVTWTWRGVQPHDITFASGSSAPIKTSGTFSRQFPAAGTYDYLCAVHGSAMSGQVVVR